MNNFDLIFHSSFNKVVTEWVSEWVTDKGCQWSDSGLIKKEVNKNCELKWFKFSISLGIENEMANCQMARA